MLDERIKKLKYSKEYLATHIANKKKRIKKVIAGDKLDRGAEKREKILQSLANGESTSSDEETSSLHQEDLPNVNRKRNQEAMDNILDRRHNEKRGRWEWETKGGGEESVWEPRESFLNEHGEEKETFLVFEAEHPYEDAEGALPDSVLTQGSRFVFNHTKKLASAQVIIMLGLEGLY